MAELTVAISVGLLVGLIIGLNINKEKFWHSHYYRPVQLEHYVVGKGWPMTWVYYVCSCKKTHLAQLEGTWTAQQLGIKIEGDKNV